MLHNIFGLQNISQNTISAYLATIPFFSEVSPPSILKLAGHVEIKEYAAGKRIFSKGDPGDALHAIFEGSVNVHDDGHDYGSLSKGDCFGEYALIDNQNRSASVTALEETTTFRIASSAFYDLMQDDAGFARGILAVMIRRHRELDEIQEELSSSKNELELANARLSGLINGAMDAIIMFNEKKRILLANPAAEELLENRDVIQRNILFFFDEKDAGVVEQLTEQMTREKTDKVFLPKPVKIIGSGGRETLNEGTLSRYGSNENFYTLILRNIEDRIAAREEIGHLKEQTEYLQQELHEIAGEQQILAGDPSMIRVLNMIGQVSATDATVLILGETGTGKELVARAIHNSSPRKKEAFIRINCGAIPANLIESELFGHEKGAFTGATISRKGRFHLAHKGTIFLDEIGELPLDLQPKLLRVIQEGEFDPVGSNETIKVDVRIVAATHRDLLQLCRDGKFREDLFYRLNVFPIHVPPLRERGSDICLIAEEMISLFCKKNNKKLIRLSPADKTLFNSYKWPGNVRELQNLIERAVIISRNGDVDWRQIFPSSKAEEASISDTSVIFTMKELQEHEKKNIIRALKLTQWKVSGEDGAAALLGIPSTTLASKIKALKIKRPI